MYVLLDNGEVVLYLASEGDGEETFVWVLSLEPYAGPPPSASSKPKAKKSTKPIPPPRNLRTRNGSSKTSSSSRSSSSSSFVHPIAKLPWFKRRPPSEIRKVRSTSVMMRLRVVPAFFIHADGGVDNDGYLLSHGLYNYDLCGQNERIIATSVV